MKGKSESEGAQSCPTLSNPMDRTYQAPPSMGFFQARVLEWGAIAFSKETISKVKRQPSEWEKITANETTDIGLISKIYTQFMPEKQPN